MFLRSPFSRYRYAVRHHGPVRAVSIAAAVLGRACILAAVYVLGPVGVELVPELCDVGRRNAAEFARRRAAATAIHVEHADAVAYTREANTDIYFMFRPFSGGVLPAVLANIKAAAEHRGTPPLVLYSERLLQSNSNRPVISADSAFEQVFALKQWGQHFIGHHFGSKRGQL